MSRVQLDQVLQKQVAKESRLWLVTGCAGFIGSHMTETLLTLGQRVRGIDNFATGFKKNLDDIKSNLPAECWKNFEFIEGDITDLSTCLKSTKNIRFVCHQAALGSVPRSIVDPLASNRVNVTGFLNLLHASVTNAVPRFVYASSSSVYGDSELLPKREDCIGTALSPYAVTKRINEMYAQVFCSNYAIETIGLRYFNVFGPRQDPEGSYAAVIPRWIFGLLSKQTPRIYGDGLTSRDFTYVEDIVQANLRAALCTRPDAYGKVFNAAAGGRYTLIALFESIQLLLRENLSNYEPVSAVFEEFRKGDIRHSCASIERIQDTMSFEPLNNLEQGLRKSISWYVAHASVDKKGASND